MYVVNTAWINEKLAQIISRNKGDGFDSEFHLPPLVAIAAQQGDRVVEIPLNDKREALGVNSLEEYQEVLELYPKIF